MRGNEDLEERFQICKGPDCDYEEMEQFIEDVVGEEMIEKNEMERDLMMI